MKHWRRQRDGMEGEGRGGEGILIIIGLHHCRAELPDRQTADVIKLTYLIKTIMKEF